MSEDTASGRGAVGGVDLRGLPPRHWLGLLSLVVLGLLPVGNLLGIESIGVLGAVTVPVSLLGESELRLLAGAFYFAMFAMSWDAVSGYTGQISFGHGLFFAIGGYTSALLNLGHGIDPVLAVPVGVVLAALAGIIIGVPALRLRGPYLSLVTLVAPLLLLEIFIFYSDIFGGEIGLGSPENIFGFGLGDAVAIYYVAFVLLLLVLGILLAVTRSNAGAVFTAIRENEDTVASVGLNPAKFKIFAFVLSAAIGGFAGAMFVHTPVGNPTPSQLLTTQVNILVIIAAVLGGMGTIVGAAIGGMIIHILPDLLSGVDLVIPVLDAPVNEVDFLLFALITLVLLFVLPGGVLRWSIRQGRRLMARSRGDDVVTDGGRTPVRQVLDSWRRDLRSGHDDGGDDDEY